MSDLNKLLEGLPIKVKSKDEVVISGLNYHRFTIETWGTLEPEERLGWRVILRLMDEYEEPAATDDNRCAVCGWPLKKVIEAGCVPGNCSQRPLPTGTEWYDPDRAVREGYPL